MQIFSRLSFLKDSQGLLTQGLIIGAHRGAGEWHAKCWAMQRAVELVGKPLADGDFADLDPLFQVGEQYLRAMQGMLVLSVIASTWTCDMCVCVCVRVVGTRTFCLGAT